MRHLAKVGHLGLALVLVAACDGAAASPAASAPPTKTAPPITLAPSQGAFYTLENVSGGCAITRAWAGVTSPTPTLAPCGQPPSFTNLPNGSLVTTDTCGQAWLKTSCGLLYVFHASTLVASTCQPPGTIASSGCVTSGTVAWHGAGCDQDLVLSAPGASVKLAGTWVSITHLADRQLTLVLLFDGTGDATPMLDARGTQPLEASSMRPGQFWFTSPGADPPVVAGILGRTTQSFDRLPAVVRELRLASWIAPVIDLARQDGIDVSAMPAIPVVNVRLAGGALEDPATLDAVLHVLDWPTAAAATLPDGDRAIDALHGTDPPVDLRSPGTDTQAAAMFLTAHGGFGMTVMVEAPGDLAKLGDRYAAVLRRSGIDAGVRQVRSEAAAATAFAVLADSGSAVIWLSDH